MENLLYYIWFAEAMGPANRKSSLMLQQEENPYRIYSMGERELRYHFSVELTRQELHALCNKDTSKAAYYLHFCEQKHVDVITIHDPRYPRKLLSIYNPPVVLYCYGQLPPVDEQLTIAMVGSRTSTVYGMTIAEKISSSLAKCGVIVVSGMARGIDTMSNQGALYGGGKTIAVMGSGINVPYPRENRNLMRDISRNGAILTEYPPDSQPDRWHFPQRNRIICGLSEGTVVVEAHEKSGALITADLALQQGRDLFAVPGNINSRTQAGCNLLIKQGSAKLITSVYDILEEYSGRVKLTRQQMETARETVVGQQQVQAAAARPAEQPKHSVRPSLPQGLEPADEPLCRLLSEGTLQLEQLAERLQRPVEELAVQLTLLEMQGVVEQLPGKRFCLKG